MSRETYWNSELEENKRNFAQENIEIQQNYAAKEQNAELTNFLGSVNFSLLKKVFTEEYIRSGLEPAQMNFIEAKHVSSNVGSIGTSGAYDSATNLIGLSPEMIRYSAKQGGYNERLAQLQVLVHEETHAVAKVVCELGQTSRDSKAKITGYQRRITDPVLGKRTIFTGFNEGVTDKIAFDILRKYLTVTQEADLETIEEFIERYRREGVYSLEQHQVDVFVSRLAENSGLSKETVWDAVKAGIISGDDMYSGELREFLEGEVGIAFISRLEKNKKMDTRGKKTRPKLEQGLRDVKAIILKLARRIS